MCCSLQGFVKAWKQPHETTKPKHRWERIEEALEIDAPAWSSTHIFLTDAYVTDAYVHIHFRRKAEHQ